MSNFKNHKRNSLLAGRFGHLPSIIFAVLVVIVSGIGLGVFFEKPQYQVTEDMLALIQNLDPEEISSIEVFESVDLKPSNILFVITEQTEKEYFLSSLMDITEWKPNHPLHKKSYIIAVNLVNEGTIKFRTSILADRQNKEIHFVFSYENMKASFKSNLFYDWLENKNLIEF